MSSKVSVIVPIYNMHNYLGRCLDSIVNQSYQNLEIILVDDGSTDDSLDICNSYRTKDNRIKVIHKENGGLGSARNAGIKVATGDYIGFVDSDDWVLKDMYKNLVRTIECSIDRTKTIACTRTIEFFEDKKMFKKRDFFNYERMSNMVYLKNLLLHKSDEAVWSKLFPQNIVHNVLFSEDRLNEDLIYMSSIVEYFNEMIFTDTYDYCYLIRKKSISHEFGKSIHDAVVNSHEIRNMINYRYPELSYYAERFDIIQNIKFMILCPYYYNKHDDFLYYQTLSFLRKNIFYGLKNKYLTFTEKVKLLVVCILPNLISFIKLNFSRKS